MECIVLAGGLGTRLQAVVDVPKCMAPVNNEPFLHYVFNYLEHQGCTRVILSLGYKHEHITNWLKTQNRSFTVDYVIEKERLGTGGGIQLALKAAKEDNVFVLNGDTMFDVELKKLNNFHNEKNAATTLALKGLKNFNRYGVVNVNENDCITSFEEKQHRDEGNINGGVYIINKSYLFDKQLPEKFSFEQDYLEAFVQDNQFYGYKSNGYFIDIGIPSDYKQAQLDFKQMF